MILRAATAADVRALTRLINDAFVVERFFIDGDRTTESAIAGMLSDPNRCFVVIDSGDRVGLAGAVRIDLMEGHGHFAMLSVAPELQGTGIGRRLVEAAEQYCRERGYPEMRIEIVDLREDLPGFYLRLGYATAETLPFPEPDKLTRAAQLVRMVKQLN